MTISAAVAVAVAVDVAHLATAASVAASAVVVVVAVAVVTTGVASPALHFGFTTISSTSLFFVSAFFDFISFVAFSISSNVNPSVSLSISPFLIWSVSLSISRISFQVLGM